jgi:6-pyruvoyl-tetrahydropterin synthase
LLSFSVVKIRSFQKDVKSQLDATIILDQMSKMITKKCSQKKFMRNFLHRTKTMNSLTKLIKLNNAISYKVKVSPEISSSTPISNSYYNVPLVQI